MPCNITAPTTEKTYLSSFFLAPFSPIIATAGTWTYTWQNNTFYNWGYMENATTHANNDACYIPVDLKAGTYTLITIWTYTDNGGIVKIKLGSTTIDTIDTYTGGGTTNNNFVSQTAIAVSSGTYNLTIAVDGKNAASSDYYCRIQGLWLVRTA